MGEGKEVTRLRWRLCAWGAVAAGATCLALALVAVTLHAYNKYPYFYSLAQQVQREGAQIWAEVCGYGLRPQPTRRVQCDEARLDSEINVRTTAAEALFSHLIADVEGWWGSHLSGLGCGSGSQCQYVLLKCLDMLVSSTLMLVLVMACAAVAVGYVYWVGPMAVQRQLRQRKMVDSQSDSVAEAYGVRLWKEQAEATRRASVPAPFATTAA